MTSMCYEGMSGVLRGKRLMLNCFSAHGFTFEKLTRPRMAQRMQSSPETRWKILLGEVGYGVFDVGFVGGVIAVDGALCRKTQG